MKYLKKALKKLLFSVGVEIRSSPSSSIGYKLSKSFTKDAIKAQTLLMNEYKDIKNLTIFDVGANKGQTAEKYHNQFPNSTIYCFEPYPESVEVLKKKIQPAQDIRIVTKAVGEYSGKEMLYTNSLDVTNSLLPRPKTERRYYPKHSKSSGSIEVDVVSLDDFTIQNNIKEIDILKFDIQGGELNALKGAKNLLESGRVSIIYTEIMFVHLYEKSPLFNEVWNFLLGFNYTLYNIYNLQVAFNGQLRYGDAIFVSESVRTKAINRFPEEP